MVTVIIYKLYIASLSGSKLNSSDGIAMKFWELVAGIICSLEKK